MRESGLGEGVFETLKVVDGQPFALSRHLRRMSASARVLGLPEVDEDAVRRAVREELARESAPLARLRLIWGPDVRGGQLLVTVEGLPVPSTTVEVVTAPWPRAAGSPLVAHKTTGYQENLVALAYAVEQGAGEALLTDTHGRLSEGTGTNVFVVVDGELRTPTLATGCLPGITRELVLEWTSARETDMSLAEAQAADEVFVVSSTRDVQAVTRWDDVEWSSPGALTAEIAGLFAERSAAEVDP